MIPIVVAGMKLAYLMLETTPEGVNARTAIIMTHAVS